MRQHGMQRGWSTALALVALAALACSNLRGQSTAPGEEVEFEVTAYCIKGITRSGVRVREGMAAADPRVLPLGSTIRVQDSEAWDGVYTVMDTGAAVKGMTLDLYLRDCDEALELGRRTMKVTVIRRGWDPAASERPADSEDE